MRFFNRVLPNSDRGKAFLRNTAVAFAGRLANAVCSIAQVPIAYHYLGPTEFGVWVTLTSLIALLGFADLGIGLGIQNSVAEALGSKSSRQIAILIGQGVTMLASLAAALYIILLIVIQYFPWGKLYHFKGADFASFRHGALVLATVFCLNLPASVFQRAMTGLQRSWIVSSSISIGNVLCLFLVYLAAHYKCSFPEFVEAASIPMLLSNLSLGILLCKEYNPLITPRSELAPHKLWLQMKLGLPFTVPQLAASAIVMIPPLIIASILGPAAVADFNIAQRLLSFFSQFQGLLMSTLWPAFTEARASGDFLWLRANYRRAWYFTIGLVALPQVAYPIWAPFALKHWIGEVTFSFALLCAFGIQAALSACSQAPAILLNSMGRVRGQATYGSSSVVLTLVTMPFAIRKWGLIAAPLTYSLWFGILNLPLVIIEGQRALKNLESTQR